MRKIGNSIVEVLVALCVLGIVVPVSLDALGNAFMADFKVKENAYMISAAEWWFTNLPPMAHIADVDAAPRVDVHGRASFAWETENLGDGAFRVTLRVVGRFSKTPLTISRIY